MAQFTLEICKNGKWETVADGAEIRPVSSDDEIRVHLFHPVKERCIISIDNGPYLRPDIRCEREKEVFSLGKIKKYYPGKVLIYFSRAGTPTEVTEYELIPCTPTPVPEPPVSVKEPLAKKPEEPAAGGSSAEVEELKKQLEDKNKAYEDLQASYQKLESELGDLRPLWESSGTLKKAIEEQRTANQKAEEDLTSLQNQKTSLDARIASQRNSNLAAAQELKELQNKHTDARKALEELKEKRKALGMLDDEIAAAEKESKEKAGELSEWKDKVKTAETEKAAAEQTLQDAEARKKQCEDDAARINSEMTSLESQNKIAETALEKLRTTYRENMELLQKHLEVFYKELHLADSGIADVNERLEVLERCLDDSQFTKYMENVEKFREDVLAIRKNVSELDKERSRIIGLLEDEQTGN